MVPHRSTIFKDSTASPLTNDGIIAPEKQQGAG